MRAIHSFELFSFVPAFRGGSLVSRKDMAMIDLLAAPVAEAPFARLLHHSVELVIAENHALLGSLGAGEVELLARAAQSGARLFFSGRTGQEAARGAVGRQRRAAALMPHRLERTGGGQVQRLTARPDLRRRARHRGADGGDGRDQTATSRAFAPTPCRTNFSPWSQARRSPERRTPRQRSGNSWTKSTHSRPDGARAARNPPH
jgi:hypothetical protein